jgi:hypothetical protein
MKGLKMLCFDRSRLYMFHKHTNMLAHAPVNSKLDSIDKVCKYDDSACSPTLSEGNSSPYS